MKRPHSSSSPQASSEAPPRGLDPLVTSYYEQAPEETRLGQGPFQLEEARTRELIRRFAPPPPGTVADIGGAAGAYALWLAEAGYTVHLVDASPRLVAEARRRSGAAQRPLASCSVGDARALDLPPHSADVVLPAVAERMADPARRATLLDAARMLETEPSVVGASAHLLAVARAPR